jgi:hypothetical protein
MKKVLLSIVLLILVAAAAGVYYLLTNLDALVAQVIETQGSKATGTAVRVDGVNIKLRDGAAAVSGLTVANPDGYAMPNAFALGQIRAGIDLKSLQEEPYVIKEIVVLAPQVFVEINENNKTNLNELKNMLQAGRPAGNEPQKAEPAAESGAAKPRLKIVRARFEGGLITAQVDALQNKAYELKLPELNMSDLGGSNGATPAELAREILQRLIVPASALVQAEIIEKELTELKNKAREKVDEEKVKLEQKVDAQKQEQMQKAEDKLKGMFDR